MLVRGSATCSGDESGICFSTSLVLSCDGSSDLCFFGDMLRQISAHAGLSGYPLQDCAQNGRRDQWMTILSDRIEQLNEQTETIECGRRCTECAASHSKYRK